MKVGHFVEPLIGLDLNEGYRITLAKEEMPEFKTVLDFLCSFGEGSPIYANIYQGDGWYLNENVIKHNQTVNRMRMTIIVNDSIKLKSIASHFNWSIKIQEMPTDIEQILMPIFLKFFARRINSKVIASLRQQIANVLHKSWYQIKFNNSTIEFEYKGKYHSIQL